MEIKLELGGKFERKVIALFLVCLATAQIMVWMIQKPCSCDCEEQMKAAANYGALYGEARGIGSLCTSNLTIEQVNGVCNKAVNDWRQFEGVKQ